MYWSPIEERDEHLSIFLTNWTVRESSRDVGEEGERYKYPPVPNGHLSRGSASLHVWHYRTKQDNKGKSEVLAILAVKLRIYV